MEPKENKGRAAEWSDRNAFTLCLALVCRDWDVFTSPHWQRSAHCQLSTEVPWSPFSSHTNTNAIADTDTHFLTLIYLSVRSDTAAQVPTEQGLCLCLRSSSASFTLLKRHNTCAIWSDNSVKHDFRISLQPCVLTVWLNVCLHTWLGWTVDPFMQVPCSDSLVGSGESWGEYSGCIRSWYLSHWCGRECCRRRKRKLKCCLRWIM